MNLTSVKTIKNLCKQYGIRPSKKLGQSFLINESILDKIIEAGELNKKDIVLEIGPGFGVLTQELVKRVGKVIAVETDKRIFDFWQKEIKRNREKYKDIKIVNDDILKIDFYCHPELVSGSRSISTGCRNKFGMTKYDYKLISNLPYQITSPVLWKFLQADNKPKLMVLMIQKEVAERIVAKPGKMSILSVMCQFYAECEIIDIVKKGNFYPEPDVDSAIIKLKLRRNKALPCSEKEFIKVVKIGFSAKRKMLKNNLVNGLKIPQENVKNALKKAGLSEKIRAQELGVEDWIKLLHVL